MNKTNRDFASVPQLDRNDNSDWQVQLQAILKTQDLSGQQREIQHLAAQLNVTVLDCAAALLCITKSKPPVPSLPVQQVSKTEHLNNKLTDLLTPTLKLVRYRLDLGSQHQLSLTQLKKVIVEESGVDINNIFNVRIQDTYTLVDLPDEMPQEIFHHLKTVEINGQKFDIRRVKARNKNYGRKRRHNRANTGGSVSSKAIT